MPPTPLPSTGVGASTVGGGGNWEKPVSADRVTQRRGSIVLVNGAKVLFPMSRVQVRSRVPFVVSAHTLPNSSFSQYLSCTHAQNVALATITCARRLFITSSSALTQPCRATR
jgi:hypothetical protein